MENKNKIFLSILEVDEEDEFVVLDKQETSLAEIANFYNYHTCLVDEYGSLKSQYTSLRNFHEATTQKNEALLTSLTSILTAHGIYDAHKNTVNLEPILKPYFEKLITERENELDKIGYFQSRWQVFKLKNNIGWKSILVKILEKAISFFTKSKKNNGTI